MILQGTEEEQSEQVRRLIRARVETIQHDRRVRLRDCQTNVDIGLGLDQPAEDGPEDGRAVRISMENEHRDRLLEARSLGHNQFPIDVINRKAELYARECLRLADRMKD